MNNGVSFLELIAILQRLGNNERDATRDEQTIAQTYDAERGKAIQRRDVAVAEIEKTRSTLTAIRKGVEADLRKAGIADRDLLGANAQTGVETNTISDLPELVRRVVRKARDLDEVLQQERRSRDIEAKAKQALADLALRPLASPPPPPPPPPPAPPPAPPAPFVEPRPRVSLPKPPSVSALSRPAGPPQRVVTRSRSPLWIALGAVVAILVGVLLYVIFH